MSVPSSSASDRPTSSSSTSDRADRNVDAVVLVGGHGTRLRPLTLSAPKPMLPTAGVPFLEHLLSRIREAGIRHVVLGTSYKAETFTEYFGDGAAFGLDIEYMVEDVPLGTGGGIRNVADRLRADTVLVFNGDVLSGCDLTALLDTHERQDSDVTLHLVKVPDPRAFGSVPTDQDGRVQAFLEKTDNPPTDQINAGCYVFRRSVLEGIPAGRVVSVERETFPGLLESGARVQGHVDSTYWLDLGTPAAFVRGSADLVTGVAPTGALPGPTGPALLLPGANVDATATVTGGSTIGRDVTVGAGAVVDGSVVFDGAQIGEGATVARAVIGTGVVLGAGTVIMDAVIGDDVVVGDNCELVAGIRIWPGLRLPAGSVRFSA
ncbi:sugar phosphate nucleotidyltransferase [Nakamurella sp. GG22]